MPSTTSVNTSSLLLARVISQVLDPTIMWPAMVGLLLFYTGLTEAQIDTVGWPLIALELIIPIGLLILFNKIGWVSDWEITKREERNTFFIIIVVLHILSVLLLLVWGNPEAFAVRLAIWVVELFGMLLTRFWKVSIHTAAFAAVVVLAGYLVATSWWWLFLLTPALMWSRVKREKHTWAQTAVGALGTVSILVVVLAVLTSSIV